MEITSPKRLYWAQIIARSLTPYKEKNQLTNLFVHSLLCRWPLLYLCCTRPSSVFHSHCQICVVSPIHVVIRNINEDLSYRALIVIQKAIDLGYNHASQRECIYTRRIAQCTMWLLTHSSLGILSRDESSLVTT